MCGKSSVRGVSNELGRFVLALESAQILSEEGGP